METRSSRGLRAPFALSALSVGLLLLCAVLAPVPVAAAEPPVQRIAVLVERRLDIAEKRAEKPATGY